MIRSILMSLVLISPAFCLAGTQQLDVKPGVVTRANLSKNDLTRLYVKDDPITDVWTVSKSLNIQQDNDAGELYITLKDEDLDEPVTLFALTEKGERFNLLLTPKTQGAETIALKTHQSTPATAKDASREDSHESRLVALIKAMHANQNHSGFAVQSLKGKKTKREGVSHQALKRYESAFWVADSFMLTNTNAFDVVISEHLFEVPKRLAVGVVKEQLHSGERTFVYVVREVAHG